MKIAIGGSSANPPTVGHEQLLKHMMSNTIFDMIIWIPCGSRNDKEESVSATDRVTMTELMIPREWKYSKKPRFLVDYSDIYGNNTPSIIHLERLQEKYPNADLVWFTGNDQDVKTWERGEELIQRFDVFYIKREGYDDIPWDVDFNIPNVSSTEVREKIQNNESIYGMVPSTIEYYINTFNLYK